jgi:hypothetical protein
MSVEETLVTRRSTHGDFTEFSEVSQSLSRVMRSSPNFSSKMTDTQIEALEMVFHKAARILTGEPDFAEHWHDIAGYATRAEERCTDYEGTL